MLCVNVQITVNEIYAAVLYSLNIHGYCEY